MKFNKDEPMIDNLSDREIVWIYDRIWSLARFESRLEAKRQSIEEYSQKSISCRYEINSNRLRSKDYLLPYEELEWIDRDDLRLLRWLIYYCARPTYSFGPPTQFLRPRFAPIPETALHHYFISELDKWDESLATKRSSLGKIRSVWSEILRNDSSLKWLNKANDSQVEWAWAYMDGYMKKHQQFHRQNYSPIGTEETYGAILSTFDTWEGESKFIYKLQDAMKQAWAQQKYRANLEKKKKKQSTYVLDNEAIINLDELAKENNVNINQMLEYIINDAYKNRKKGTPKKYTDEGNLNSGDQKLTQD